MIDRDTIIKLAREAGFRTGSYTLSNGEGCVFAHPVSFSDCIPELERFAALVATAEREACAKVCEQRAGTVSMFASMREARTHNDAVKGDAAAIRARSQA